MCTFKLGKDLVPTNIPFLRYFGDTIKLLRFVAITPYTGNRSVNIRSVKMKGFTMFGKRAAVVWDIEDVTPSISSTFVKGLRGAIRKEGTISLARVYGNFGKKRLSQAAEELHRESFEMIHLPESVEERFPTILTARTIDMLNRHPQIDELILISGRGSLSPLVRQVREFDVDTMVICDARKVDEQLLLLSDSYCDFRDLTIVPMEEEEEGAEGESLDIDQSLILLQEAVAYITQNGGKATSDLVRVRLKLMNEHFDEALFGFSSWNGYLTEAQKRGTIHARFKDNDLILTTPVSATPEVIRTFLKALGEASKIRTSEGRKAKLPDIGGKLKEAGFDYHRHGYSKLKKLADGAAKRGLVLVSLNESNYFLDLTKKGSDLLEELQ